MVALVKSWTWFTLASVWKVLGDRFLVIETDRSEYSDEFYDERWKRYAERIKEDNQLQEAIHSCI